MSVIGRVAMAVGKAADQAGVQLATGDTKVVDHGSGDGIYLHTAGIGVIPDGLEIGPRRARVGNAVIVGGDIGVHGVALMSCREGLEFGTTIESDTAPLHELVEEMLGTGVDVRALRDPTRGGVSATLNEIAKASGVGIEIVERDLPIPPEVQDACGLLGLDPLQVANEGQLIAIVPAEDADRILETMHGHRQGVGARRIGTCVAEHPGMLVARTALGGTRVVDLPIGEQLPGSADATRAVTRGYGHFPRGVRRGKRPHHTGCAGASPRHGSAHAARRPGQRDPVAAALPPADRGDRQGSPAGHGRPLGAARRGRPAEPDAHRPRAHERSAAYDASALRPGRPTFLVAGSKFRGPTQPLWVATMAVADDCAVRHRGFSTPASSALLPGPERDPARANMLRTWPNYATYEQRTDRRIKVFRLIPTSA